MGTSGTLSSFILIGTLLFIQEVVALGVAGMKGPICVASCYRREGSEDWVGTIWSLSIFSFLKTNGKN